MKKLLLITLSLFLSLSNSFAEKYGLIIAVGEYDYLETGWFSINSENDIPFVKNTYTKLGVNADNIAIIQDEQATKQNIINELKKLSNLANDGDMILIHYSGHGQQIADDNQDELDRLDEALIPINANAKWEYGQGKNHLRDDEIGIYLNKIRNKIGKTGHLIVFIDACHSATGTRGKTLVRGGNPPCIPDDWDYNNKDNEGGFGLISENKNTRGIDPNLGKFIVFSGASANEINYETRDELGKPVGALTYCVNKAFSNISETDTYLSVFNKIQAEMLSKGLNQTPALEGDYNYKVFNGDIVRPLENYKVINVIDSLNIEIDGGILMGLGVGSKVELYNTIDNSNEEPTTKLHGEVTISNNLTSVVTLNNPIRLQKDDLYRVIIAKKRIENNKIAVFLNVSEENDSIQLIKELSKIPSVYLQKDSEIEINNENTNGGKHIAIYNSLSGEEIARVNINDENYIQDIATTIKNYSQGLLLNRIDLYDKDFNIDIELLPVSASINNDGTISNITILNTMDYIDNLGIINFPTSIFAYLKVINKNNNRVYFNIIDIQPNGVINPIVPTSYDLNGNNFFVEPNDTIILKDFIISFSPPYGKEIFKIISSNIPFNITPTITSVGISSRGNDNPIVNAFKSPFISTRGNSTIYSREEDIRISTDEYIFKIVELK